ncbi:MAG: FHA domain-containing protein [Muribaculaceae bacterium]|nr:FHA domain-containing protein [Muribaculaceae bacterium]
MENINVKCPWCSAVLKIKAAPGIDNASLCCPVCKKTSPFSQFKKFVAEESETQFVNHPGSGNSASGLKSVIGKLVIPSKGIAFQLKLGRNIIGRKASTSTANFQISTGESKRLSREHIIIDVKRLSSGGVAHHVSLVKERVNKTYLNNSELTFGDTLILQNGDMIKLPDVNILFELPDEERTQL